MYIYICVCARSLQVRVGLWCWQMASRFFAEVGKSPVRNVGSLLETIEKIKGATATGDADAVKVL